MVYDLVVLRDQPVNLMRDAAPLLHQVCRQIAGEISLLRFFTSNTFRLDVTPINLPEALSVLKRMPRPALDAIATLTVCFTGGSEDFDSANIWRDIGDTVADAGFDEHRVKWRAKFLRDRNRMSESWEDESDRMNEKIWTSSMGIYFRLNVLCSMVEHQKGVLAALQNPVSGEW